MFSALHLLSHAPAQAKELKETGEVVTDIVFSALERNVLIGVIALLIMAIIAREFFARRDRKTWDDERKELTTQLAMLQTQTTTAVTITAADSNDARTKDKDEIVGAMDDFIASMVDEFAKVRGELDTLYRETVDKLDALRRDDQKRNDRREDNLRKFALDLAAALRDMRDHFQSLGARHDDENRRDPS